MTPLSPVRASRRRIPALLGVLAAALGLVAAGCGSSKSSSGAETATTAAAATTAATTAKPATTTATTAAGATTTAASGGAAGTTVAATESEFKIELAPTTYKAGTYTFNSTNAGSFKHNITIDGPGVEDEKTENIDPGKSGSVTVTLQPGTYEIYCSIPTHKDKGMDTTITVS
jgi:uncharacterized cupredoxin-like copper-binding protein